MSHPLLKNHQTKSFYWALYLFSLGRGDTSASLLPPRVPVQMQQWWLWTPFAVVAVMAWLGFAECDLKESHTVTPFPATPTPTPSAAARGSQNGPSSSARPGDNHPRAWVLLQPHWKHFSGVQSSKAKKCSYSFPGLTSLIS